MRTIASFTHKIGRWVRRVETSCTTLNIAGTIIFKPGTINDDAPYINAHLLSTQALLGWIVSVPTQNHVLPSMRDLVSEWLALMVEKAL